MSRDGRATRKRIKHTNTHTHKKSIGERGRAK